MNKFQLEAYLADELANANNYHGADGMDFDYADAGQSSPVGASAQSSRSSMFTITLTNNSTSAISSVALFNSYINRAVTNQGLNANISVSSLSNVPYLALLAQSENEPFEVSETIITCSSTGQVTALTSMLISTTEASGQSYGNTIQLVKNPFQYSTDQKYSNTPFKIDGYTSLTIPSLLGSETMTFQFVIGKKASLAGQAFNGRPISIYSNPGIVGTQFVGLQGQK